MPRFFAADFRLQNKLNLSFERASLINILQCFLKRVERSQPNIVRSRSSVQKPVRLDFACNTLLTREGEESVTAILLLGKFVCSTVGLIKDRGKARVISEIVIDGSKVLRTA